MAIQAHLDNEYGLEASKCYISIQRFSGNKTEIELDILIYATAAAKTENKRPLRRDRIVIPYPTQGIQNILGYCYSELKKLPKYSLSEDI